MTWKKGIIIVLDVVLAVYLVMAMTAFNKPDQLETAYCQGVQVNIEKEIVDGFLSPGKVKQLLQRCKLDPTGQALAQVDTRRIEETLQADDLIDKVECYKSIDGHVVVNIKQRIPVIRVMADNGNDYYVDYSGKVMPHTQYACNLIVATGHITQRYAETTLAPLANLVLGDKFWKNQIVQLNILADGSVEIVPRVGDHVAYIGQPKGVTRKLDRLRKFYKYGLSKAGWNKYERVSVEFDNQIICKRHKK